MCSKTTESKRVIISLDYRKLAGISSDEEEEEDKNLVFVESETSNSFLEDTASIHMVGTPNNFKRRMDEQERVIQSNKNPLMRSNKYYNFWSEE